MTSASGQLAITVVNLAIIEALALRVLKQFNLAAAALHDLALRVTLTIKGL